MITPSVFQLNVQKNQQVCSFELSWGKGQRLCAQLDFPETLEQYYSQWKEAYLQYYGSGLRARTVGGGSGVILRDWRAELMQAEASLVTEFHRWLRNGNLFEIRQRIVDAVLHQQNHYQLQRKEHSVKLFLRFESIELARLPWETWEISTKLVPNICVARTPATIREEPALRKLRRKPRFLVILGDETGQNFKEEKQALGALWRIVDVEFVGWQPGKDFVELQKDICTAISDQNGWDGMFFFGHSNEATHLGGELGIAPGKSIFIGEIKEQLIAAKKQGLQFALFNSCNGLTIAESLIDLGLNQVVIMREPIHNKVAQEFFSQFIKELAQHKDAHNALKLTCQHLESEQIKLKYPSARLVPSLFVHSNAELFRIEPSSFKQWRQTWLPSKPLEITTLAIALVLSLLHPVQDFLLEWRILVQAIYRDVTAQIPHVSPSILLVQIDSKSIREAGISDPYPMPRDYVASIIDRLSALNAKVIGVDYVMDRLQPGKDQILAQSVKNAIAKNDAFFVFAAIEDEAEGKVGVNPKTGIASNQVPIIQGSIHALPSYVELPPAEDNCKNNCPFAYLLSIAYALELESTRPKLSRSGDLLDYLKRVVDYLNQKSKQTSLLTFLQKARLQPITSLSDNVAEQLWLQPINDFSVPPNQVYQRVFAWQLFDKSFNSPALQKVEQKVVIVAPGGYDEAGVTLGADNFPVPMAMSYWRKKQQAKASQREIYPKFFTGAEAHAYAIYHWRSQQLVIPIPDFWMILIASLIGKWTILMLPQQQQQQRWVVGLAITTTVYGLTGLQVYILANLLLPWFFPSAVFWLYVIPNIKR
jgi:CHASE2 domain